MISPAGGIQVWSLSSYIVQFLMFMGWIGGGGSSVLRKQLTLYVRCDKHPVEAQIGGVGGPTPRLRNWCWASEVLITQKTNSQFL